MTPKATSEVAQLRAELDQTRRAVADLVSVMLPSPSRHGPQFITPRLRLTLAAQCPDALKVFDEFNPTALETRDEPDVHDQGHRRDDVHRQRGWYSPLQS